MGIEDRDYLRDRRPPFGAADDDGGGASTTPLWAKIVLVLLVLSLAGSALVGVF
ncbi:MAG: hypothetical protein U1E39_01530 [Planctomycetota bacterium]